MKTVMCFGDSQTWGYIPGTGERMPYEKRWPGVLQQNVGNDIRIIEEALSGRTTIWDDAFLPDRNGRTVLPVLLESHSPMDLFILMLGGNDLQTYRGLKATEAARGCRSLIQIVQKSRCGPKKGIPQILLIAPPIKGQVCGFQKMLTYGAAEEESPKIPGLYEQIAKFCGCRFFDSNKVVKASEIDGVHIDENEHHKLGLALKDFVIDILNSAS